ncbi:MAG: GNAT family N-acetyltransferase [Sulfitobacter sp.]
MINLTDGYHDVPQGKLAMVVTHLEMLEKAPLRDVTLPEGLTLRQVTPDYDWYRDALMRVGALEWLWYERLRMERGAVQAILDDPKVTFITLAKNGRDEALLELDFRQDGACELAYFGVTPALIGQGAGAALMNEAIIRAWAQPINRFHLHTCTLDSPQALGFYIRSGFTPFKRQIEIADDPRLLGLLPQTAAPHVPILKTA